MQNFDRWVHLECLRKWQKEVVLTQPTHPKYHTDIDKVCNICLEPFTGVGIPPTRHSQILKYTGGDIAAMVQPGNLLVSSREGSRENLELIAMHPEIRDRLMTWTKASFLMLSTRRGGLMAVSMSKPVDGPPRDVALSGRQRKAWTQRTRQGEQQQQQRAEAAGGGGEQGAATAAALCRVRHWDGGPMQRNEPIAVAHVPNASKWVRRSGGGCDAVPPDWVYGEFDAVEAVCDAANADSTTRKPGAGGTWVSGGQHTVTTINLVWGCGGWGGTQVLAEIARGGWGLVSIEDYLSIRPDQAMEMDWSLDFSWSRVVPLAKLAPRSEYTRRGN